MPSKSTPTSTKRKPASKPKAVTKPVSKAAKRPVSKATAKNHAPVKPTVAPTKESSKQAQLIDMLSSEKGGTIDQMMELTGWQSHTVRGTISGVLRKRLGLKIEHVGAVFDLLAIRVGNISRFESGLGNVCFAAQRASRFVQNLGIFLGQECRHVRLGDALI